MLYLNPHKLLTALRLARDVALAIPAMIALWLGGAIICLLVAAVVYAVLFIPLGGLYALFH